MIISKRQQDKLVCIKFRFDIEKIGLWYEKYNKVRRKRKEILYHKQNKKCDVCRNEMWLVKDNKPRGHEATIDHVIPISKNGSDHWSNWTITCSNCNNTRGHMDYSSFKENYKSIFECKKQKKIEKSKSMELSDKDKLRHNIKIFYIALTCMLSEEYKNILQKTLAELKT